MRQSEKLYQLMSASFCVLIVMSNILSAKMVPLPLLPLTIPAGLITYPLTFVLSDLVTEIFGAKRAKFMVYLGLGMSLLSLGIGQVGVVLPGLDGPLEAVLGLSSLRVFASLTSYLTSQVVDVQLYAALKRRTGPRFLWLRSNGSTCVSQIVDTVMIDLIFLWWGLGMSMAQAGPIMLFSYVYKSLFSLACTPLFYLLVFLIRGRTLTKGNLWIRTAIFPRKHVLPVEGKRRL